MSSTQAWVVIAVAMALMIAGRVYFYRASWSPGEFEAVTSGDVQHIRVAGGSVGPRRGVRVPGAMEAGWFRNGPAAARGGAIFGYLAIEQLVGGLDAAALLSKLALAAVMAYFIA